MGFLEQIESDRVESDREVRKMAISHRTLVVLASFGIWISAAAFVCKTGAGRQLLPEAAGSVVKVSHAAGNFSGVPEAWEKTR
jgi:hypothetical protein